jgi:hypothetical protein
MLSAAAGQRQPAAARHRRGDSEDSAHDKDYIALPTDFSVLAVSQSQRTQAQPRDHQVDSLLAKRANLSHRARGDVALTERDSASKNQGRDDRATTEQVMDPRTRLILFKMLARGLLEEIHGCVSTGKEANVYARRCGPLPAG